MLIRLISTALVFSLTLQTVQSDDATMRLYIAMNECDTFSFLVTTEIYIYMLHLN